MTVAEGLGIEHLREFWERKVHGRSDAGQENDADAWVLERTLLAGLRLNMLETFRYLATERPAYEEFEEWIAEQNGGSIPEERLDRLRRALAGETVGPEVSLDGVDGLSEAELQHWDEHGYVVLKNAVRPEMAEAAELAIYRHLRMDRDDPESWYSAELGHTIWVPLLRDQSIEANRRSARMMKAFAQLWGREDLWVTFDQAGLNPPEREGWPFPGPHLHWDTTLAEPHYLEVQGILYLADVAADQGAFSCVPGFHRTLGDWLREVPEGVDAREFARATLKMKPIAAERGDMVLWHQSLPHGASPNRAKRPRVAQYISMHPTRWQHNPAWR